MKNHPALYIILFALLLDPILIAAQETVPAAGSARWLSQRRYDKAEREVQDGEPIQKVRAARFLGARGNPRYLRILGDELLRDLDADSPALGYTRNDPYIKSQIAWALGRSRHIKAVDYLLKALERTVRIINTVNQDLRQKDDTEQKVYEQDRRDYRDRKSREFPVKNIRIPQRIPGPFIWKMDHQLPYSPDVYWSISNDFKNLADIDESDQSIQIRKHGFNYVNVVFYIFEGIGEIYMYQKNKSWIKRGDVEAVAQYLDGKYMPFIRGAAAISLRQIGSPQAVKFLDQAYGKEKNEEVRMKISYAILSINKARIEHFQNLIRGLQSDEEGVRYAAAAGLRDLEIGESYHYLQEALRIEPRPVIRNVLKEAVKNARLNDLWVPY